MILTFYKFQWNVYRIISSESCLTFWLFCSYASSSNSQFTLVRCQFYLKSVSEWAKFQTSFKGCKLVFFVVKIFDILGKNLDFNIFVCSCKIGQLFCSRLGKRKVSAAWTSETADASRDNEAGDRLPPVTMEGQSGWVEILWDLWWPLFKAYEIFLIYETLKQWEMVVALN